MSAIISQESGGNPNLQHPVSKAIGLGMRMPMTWRLCEVGRKPSGQPTIVLHGVLKAWCDQKRLSAHVSLSDESDYATSYVIVEQAEP